MVMPDPLSGAEREITTPVDLCDARGRLAAGAAGWSRHPLHRANLKGPWGRRKRWEYWCVTTPELSTRSKAWVTTRAVLESAYVFDHGDCDSQSSWYEVPVTWSWMPMLW